MLTEKAIEALKPETKPYRVPDGQSLFIQVSPSGARLWRYRYRINGKQKALAIGVWPKVKGAEARRLAGEARQLVEQGTDPAAEKRTVKQRTVAGAKNTFRVVCEEWQKHAWGDLSDATKEKLQAILDQHVFPELGDKPMNGISTTDVLTTIKNLTGKGILDIAKRALSLIKRIFSYAIVHQLADTNPAAGPMNAAFIDRGAGPAIGPDRPPEDEPDATTMPPGAGSDPGEVGVVAGAAERLPVRVLVFRKNQTPQQWARDNFGFIPTHGTKATGGVAKAPTYPYPKEGHHTLKWLVETKAAETTKGGVGCPTLAAIDFDCRKDKSKGKLPNTSGIAIQQLFRKGETLGPVLIELGPMGCHAVGLAEPSWRRGEGGKWSPEGVNADLFSGCPDEEGNYGSHFACAPSGADAGRNRPGVQTQTH